MYFIILFIGHRSFLKNCYVLLAERKAYAGWINLEHIKKFHTALNRQKEGEGVVTDWKFELFILICFSIFCILNIKFSTEDKRMKTFYYLN